MTQRTTANRRRSVKVIAGLLSAGLVAAACGDDSSSSATTAAATSAAATTAAATTAAATTAAGTTAAATTTAAAASNLKFATLDEIAALCPAANKPAKLVFSTFPAQKDAMDKYLAPFKKALGIEVEWLENGLGDRLTKLAAEKGKPTIDVALVPIAETPALLANGIVEPTNTKLPNYEQLISAAKFAGGYGVSALQFGIAYNPAFVNPAPTSWLDLLNPKYAGHIALPSMPNSGGYALLAMLARIGGGKESDLKAAIDQIAAFKKQAHSFIGPTPQVEAQIKSGEIRMYLDIGGVAVRAKAERNVPVEFVIPKEGAPLSINSLVIPAGSKHKGCAEAFVAYMLGQEVQVGWAETLLYGSTSSIVKMEPALVSRLYPAPGAKTIVEIDWPAIAKGTADTMDYWNRKVLN
jgi:putative spermidine/putrescine transport system substrate-binding protein